MTRHHTPVKPRPISKKRFAVAVLLLPATLPFALICIAAELWHFKVSQPFLHWTRLMRKRRDAFFASLDQS